VATVADLRSGKITSNDLAERLAADNRLGMSREKIDSVIASAAELSGRAAEQVDGFSETIAALLSAHPEAASYEPAPIL